MRSWASLRSLRSSNAKLFKHVKLTRLACLLTVSIAIPFPPNSSASISVTWCKSKTIEECGMLSAESVPSVGRIKR